MMLSLIILGFFLVFLVCGVPIAIAIGLAAIIGPQLGGFDFSIVILPQKMFIASNSFTLMAIPFFMLAGTIMEHSGITQKLINFADAVVGWMKYGLCYVTVIAGMLMAGISGSAAADTSALSAILIPAMNKMGYPKKFIVPLVASSGTIGVIIPPSITFIILGNLMNVSVARLFMAGIIPGILIAVGLMLTSRIVCSRIGLVLEMTSTKFSMKKLWSTFLDALLSLFAPIIIVGGIMFGIFTPTEASVIVVFYAFILGFFVYKTIKLNSLIEIVFSAAKGTAIVMFVVGTSMVFSWIMTICNVPAAVGNFIASISENPIFVLLFITAFFFICAMFIDGTPLIIMLVPIFYPLALSVGINPWVFAVILCINSAIGAVSPPVGTALFISCTIANIGIEKTIPYTIPFLISSLIVTILLMIYPALITFIPSIVR